MADFSDRRLHVSIDHLREGVQIVGFDWTYLYLNDAAVRQARREREELIGHRMMDCYPGLDRTPLFTHLEDVMTTRRADRLRSEFEYPDGHRNSFDLVIEPVPDGICILSIDITERLIAERRLQRSQKMAAFAQLTAGIAHDFNNVLTAVIGYTDLVLEDERVPAPIATDIMEIKRAGERASRLTRQLLAFTRKQAVHREVLDLNQVMADFNQMLTRVIGDDVAIDLRTSPRAAHVNADAGQLEQIVLNLAINARDAMPQGGPVVISTGFATVGPGTRGPSAGATGDRYVTLAVADKGVGMTPDVQGQILEPFFTTKPQGKGTGLGLAMVSSIVHESGGWMTIESAPGAGTTVTIFLPEATPPPAVEAAAAAPDRRVEGSETILLVEHDSSVSRLMSRVLKGHGYDVIEARGVSEAMAMVREPDRRIDLLITDLIMPDLHGPNLAQRVVNHHRSARVLYVAEAPVAVDEAVGVLSSRLMFLAKPFTAHDLVASVRDALDSAG